MVIFLKNWKWTISVLIELFEKREQIKSDANSCGYERKTRVRLKYSPLNYENEELVIESIAFGHGLEIFSFYYTHVVRGFLYISRYLGNIFFQIRQLSIIDSISRCFVSPTWNQRRISAFLDPNIEKPSEKYFISVSHYEIEFGVIHLNRLFIL